MLMPVPAKVDRRPLIAYLRVQRNAEEELQRRMVAASNQVGAQMRQLMNRNRVGAGVRLEQLAFVQANLHREMGRLFAQVGDITEAAKRDGAAEAVETMYPGDLLRQVIPDEDVDYLMRSAREQAKRGLLAAEARMNLSQIPLSQKVWRTEQLVNGQIDDIINSHLITGSSAADLAKDVIGYVNPNTPGGPRYAASRLARTEINNAFHATQVQEGIRTPWTVALRWNLSSSHPRPDECNDYADSQHFEGGEAGLWKPDDVPSKPHPNCLCFTTPETLSREDFIRQFQAGEYDTYLVDEFGPELRPIAYTPSFPPRLGEHVRVGQGTVTWEVISVPGSAGSGKLGVDVRKADRTGPSQFVTLDRLRRT